ncbi:transcription initiation factor TFIID subunit 7 [Entomortierella parvispora]|uniref:Transcription initiation factor TFIID subunit 7 n=1 Tax=Entomortierella parvispora TaxID=205924 RepID=A0A9P3H5J6_9FUNG|nr:transcription initiation factor TFIID subunit 7 [Entomortierella parvispora]
MYPQPIGSLMAGQSPQAPSTSSPYMTSSTPTMSTVNSGMPYSSQPSIPQYPSASSTPTSSVTPNIQATSTLGPVMLSSPATVLHPSTFPAPSGLPPLPVTLSNTPPGTAPRKQLAAAAAAGAAAGSTGSSATAGKSGRPKGPYKKAGATGKRGGAAGGRGGRGGRGGGRGGHTGGGGRDGDDYMDEDAKGNKDSDDDNDEDPEVSIEEQFILRLPDGPMCDRFREKVIAREIDETVILRFKDPRRGTFIFEGQQLPTKLVDLPTIIEAQKTLNGKQMYKIADISQMLIVDPNLEDGMIKTESQSNLTVASAQTGPSSTLPPLKQSEYVWPDGLTNPLKNVRKRRFRKRISKVAVEGVENEIERLLQEDAEAEEVIYEIREQVDGLDRYDSEDGATPAPDEGGRPRAGQSDVDMDDQEMMDMDEEEEEEDDDLDLLAEDLERQIDAGESEEEGTPQPGQAPQQQQKQRQPSGDRQGLGMFGESSKVAGSIGPGSSVAAAPSSAGQAKTSGDKGKEPRRGDDEDEDEDDEDDEEDDEEEEDDDDDDDDSGSEEDDDDEEDDREKLLKDEIKDLHIKVKESDDKVQSAPNDLLKRRFGTMLENLRKELELKMMQLEEVKASKSKKSK